MGKLRRSLLKAHSTRAPLQPGRANLGLILEKGKEPGADSSMPRGEPHRGEAEREGCRWKGVEPCSRIGTRPRRGIPQKVLTGEE